MSLELIHLSALVVLTAGLLLAARVIYASLAGFDVDHELTVADNPAVGTSLFGFMAGVVIVLAGLLATEGPSPDAPLFEMGWDIAEVGAFGFLAILLLKLSGWLNDKLILHSFENKKELVDDRNVGVGAALAGSYIASGLILAGAFSGRVDPDLMPEGRLAGLALEMGYALAFYVVGQIVLVIYGQIYQRLQPENVHEAIERDYEIDGVVHGGNAAAGLAFGGNLAALGIVLWGGARHDFSGWGESLTTFGVAAGLGLVLLPLWRIFVDRVLLGKGNMAEEIFRDRNMNAALLESIALAGLATVLALMV